MNSTAQRTGASGSKPIVRLLTASSVLILLVACSVSTTDDGVSAEGVSVEASADGLASEALDQGMPPVVITFDEYPVGTAIEDQYTKLGIVFERDGAGQAPVIAADEADPTSPSLSGVPRFRGSISAHFVDAAGDPRTVDTFTFDLGYVDALHTIAVTTSDASGTALKEISIEDFGFVTVTIATKGIASFSVADSDDPSGFGIDNLFIPGGSPSDVRYVAMGDSYSAGEGAPPFDAGTDVRGNRCHRSGEAWPRILSVLKPALLPPLLIACSGAKASDITVTSHYGESAQIQRLKVLGTEPDIITVTIGGNDVGFARILLHCVILNCARDGTLDERIRFVKEDLPSLLSDTLRAIHAVAPDARLILVGYPSLVPSDHSLKKGCHWLSRSESQGLVQMAAELDTVEHAVVAEAHAEFVSQLDALQGHELCTAQSWVNPVSVFRAVRHYSGHPSEAGQQALATGVASYLKQA